MREKHLNLIAATGFATALLVTTLLATALLAITLFSAAVAHADQEINQRRDAAPDGLVKITNTRGDMDIRGWDENAISVTGSLDDLAEGLTFTVDGDEATIEVKLPLRNLSWGDGSDLKIHVPRMSRVIFSGVSADAKLRDIGGGIKVESVSGDIFAEKIGKRIQIKTISGDIDVKDSQGTSNVATVSGDVDLDMHSEKVVLDTVSGDMDARVGAFGSLVARAVSGDLEIEGALSAGGKIDISSVSSEIDLGLADPVNAAVSAETGPGGDIHNDLSSDPVKEKFPARNSLQAELGDGRGTINLRTISGEIKIRAKG